MANVDLKTILEPHLIRNETPDREVYYSVREAVLIELAARRGQTLTEIMRACLEQGLWPERFRAQRGTMTAADQARLLGSSVAVIGAGGLGGSVCLLLARTGVGALTVCDGDDFDESNLNRQFLSKWSRLGLNKAQCAVEEIQTINPAVEVRAYPVWATERNLPRILAKAQVVVDCLDSLRARLQVEKAARDLNVPFIHGAVAGLEGMVMSVFPGDPGLGGIYGSTPVDKKNTAEAYLGVPAVIPAMVAALQVNEVVHILLGREAPARRKMLHVDLSAPAIEAIQFV